MFNKTRKGVIRAPARQNASGLHKRIHGLLQEIFPSFTIKEEQSVEVVVKGRKTILFLDLLVKELMLAIECNGEQHDKFNSHFHGTSEAFQDSLARDKAKVSTLIDAGYYVLVLDAKTCKKITTSQLSKRILDIIKGKP